MYRQVIILVAVNLIMLFTSLKADFNKKLKHLVSQSPPAWMLKQLDQEFKDFKANGISAESIDQTMLAPGNEYSVRYKIQSQHISYSSNDEGPFLEDRRAQILSALNKLVTAVQLPDVDIIINPLDSAFFSTDSSLAPVFVFSKDKNIHNQILIPDLDALNNYRKIGVEIESANKRFPWKLKKEKAFWRGATTGGAFQTAAWDQLARAKLVLFSLKNPKLVDAKFNIFVQGAEVNPSMLSMPELKVNSVTPADSLKYKYLMDVDGNTCSWQRMYWILLSNSVLLKQVTNNIEWYYVKLKPYEHYIPIQEDLSDLFKKIKWTKKNDDKARKIAKNASKFAKKNLSEEMIYLYLYWAIVRYAELQVS